MSVWLLLWTVLDAYLDLGICGLIYFGVFGALLFCSSSLLVCGLILGVFGNWSIRKSYGFYEVLSHLHRFRHLSTSDAV